MTIKPLKQADHNTLRGWNDVPSNLMSKPRNKTNRNVAVAPPITAPVTMMSPMNPPMNEVPLGTPANAAPAAPEPVNILSCCPFLHLSMCFVFVDLIKNISNFT